MTEIQEGYETIRTFELAEPVDAAEEEWLAVTAELRLDADGEWAVAVQMYNPKTRLGGDLHWRLGTDSSIDCRPRIHALMRAAMEFLRASARGA